MTGWGGSARPAETAREGPTWDVVGGVRLPGFPDPKAEWQQLAEKAAAEAAVAAGLPGPAPDQDPAELLHSIRLAIRVIEEAMASQDRKLARSTARQASAPAPGPSPRAALTLADLRDRLRVLAAAPDQPGDVGGESGRDSVTRPDEPSRLGWIIDRLSEALRQLGVAEYLDTGPVDLARHQVVGRCPADARHSSGTIASSVRSGLLLSGDVLRPQRVVVYADPTE
jgi:hypothetical protein